MHAVIKLSYSCLKENKNLTMIRIIYWMILNYILMKPCEIIPPR